eukprot:293811-Chlamydomonas_euryale.AAC.11
MSGGCGNDGSLHPNASLLLSTAGQSCHSPQGWLSLELLSQRASSWMLWRENGRLPQIMQFPSTSFSKAC